MTPARLAIARAIVYVLVAALNTWTTAYAAEAHDAGRTVPLWLTATAAAAATLAGILAAINTRPGQATADGSPD